MIIVLYWLTLWLYDGLWLLSRVKKNAAFTDASLSLPLGAAFSGLCALLLWMFGVNFRLTACVIEVVSVVIFAKMLSGIRLPSAKVISKLLERGKRSVGSFFTQSMPWPEAVLWTIVLFSFAVIGSWQLIVEPVAWDNITLYDFRAQRIAEGWLPADFFPQFSTNPYFFAYDFLHPFLPSVLSAFIYKSGGSHTPLIVFGLLFCVLAEALKVFKTKFARLTFAVLFLASPLFLTSAVEGYGVWLATLFWSLFFLAYFRKEQLGKVGDLFLSAVSAAAIQSRLSEPYWIIIAGVFFWRKKLTVFLPTFLTLVSWQWLAKQVSEYGIRGDGSVTTDFSRLTSIYRVLFAFVLNNPAMPYFLCTAIAAFFLWKHGVRVKSLLDLFLIIVGSSALLIVGMAYYYLQGDVMWREVQFSLTRAVLPVVAMAIIFVAGAVEHLQQKKSLIH